MEAQTSEPIHLHGLMRPVIAVEAIIGGNPLNIVMPLDSQNRWRDR